MHLLSRRKKHRTGFFIVLTLLISISIAAVLCSMYLAYLRNMVMEDSRDYLMEVSEKTCINIRNIINTNLAVLDTMSLVLHDNKRISTLEDAQSIMKEELSRWSFSGISLIAEDGTWFHSNGKREYISMPEYLPLVAINRQPVVTNVQVMYGKEAIIFAIPVSGLTIEGTRLLALAATYEIDSMNDILSLTAFDGNGYAYIINLDGSIVVRPNHQDAEQTGYNLLNYLRDTDVYTTLAADIAAGKSGFTEYRKNRTGKYLNYSPIGIQNWCLVTVIPTSVVNTKSNQLFRTTILVCGGVTVAFALILLVSLLMQVQNRKRLELMAFVDPITNGSNKHKFEQDAEIQIRLGKRQYALFYTNLEKFKLINDRYGRAAGDVVLSKVYDVIKSMLRENELIGRLTADNFGILMEYTDTPALNDRLRDIYRKVSLITDEQNNPYGLEITFGVYFPRQEEPDIITMLDRANLARQTPRHSSLLCYSVYDDTIKQRMLRDKFLENKMQAAFDERHFVIYLQPKIRLSDKRIGGAEALVRWKDPAEGLIFPDSFIPLFERNGFITKLDLYVFEEVCKMLRRWIHAGIDVFPISVNLSRANLNDPNFLGAYRTVMKTYGIPGSCIEFEVTETMVYDNLQALRNILKEIHGMGCTCSMDDFGSAYSSLNMLKNVPVDILKLDKEFFNEDKDDSGHSMDIVEGIIVLAKKMRLTTVCEGIESMKQVAYLEKLGCDYIQGYVFDRPLPIDEFEYKYCQAAVR